MATEQGFGDSLVDLVIADIGIKGRAEVTLPAGMSAEEADRLVAAADEASARKMQALGLE